MRKPENLPKFFETIAERANFGVGIVNSEHRLVYCNDYFAKIHGYTVEEVIGQGLEIFHNSEQMEKIRQINEDILKVGSIESIEVEHTHRNGQIFPMLMSVIAHYQDNGSIDYIAATAIDLTETKRAQQALRESEQRYKLLLDTIPHGIEENDLDGKIVFANPAHHDLLGVEKGSLIGGHIWDFTVDESHKQNLIEYFEYLKREQPAPAIYQSRNRRADGEVIDVEVNWDYKRNGDGELRGFIAIMTDVTERNRAINELRKSEEQIRAIFESSHDCIAVIDCDYVHRYVNRAALELCGRTKEQTVGQSIEVVFADMPYFVERWEHRVRDVFDTGRNAFYHDHGLFYGREAWSESIVMPLRDSAGEIFAAAIVYRDVTKKVLRERELQEYDRKMTEAERLASLGTISASIAHELNQPLTVLRLLLEDCHTILCKVEATCPIADNLKDCLSEVGVIDSIVARFRNFARKSSRDQISSVNISITAGRILGSLQKAADKAGISLSTEGLRQAGFIEANAQDVEQVFFCLVQNSIQAARGTGKCSLLVRGKREEGFVVMKFIDTCSGIEKEILDKIFDPFFTTKASGEGTGLGLCIVERILKKYGGSISVESEAGRGTSFCIRWPVKSRNNFTE